jgi:enoyl-[acyl-carrier protein] reductase II
MRVIRNRVVREWAGNDAQTPPQPDPPQTIGKTMLGGREYLMPKFAAILPTPETTGDFEEMCLAAGESAALVTTIGSAQAIVQTIAQEAEQILEQQRTAVGPIHPKRFAGAWNMSVDCKWMTQAAADQFNTRLCK